MDWPKVSIIIPVVRPEKAKRCIQAVNDNAGIPQKNIEIIVEEDQQGIGCPKMVKRLVERTSNDLVVFLGDDTIPQKYFLIRALLTYIEKYGSFDGSAGLVGLYDGENSGDDFSTHWLAHKGILEFLPNKEFFYTGYHHNFCDYELADHCKEHGVYVVSKGAKVKHDHPAFKRGKGMDSHYMRVYDKGKFHEDQKLFWQRKRNRKAEKQEFYPSISEPNVREYIHADYHTSFHAMDKYRGEYLYAVPDRPTTDFPTDWSRIRNNLAVQSLNAGCTHHIMFDTDQVMGRDALKKLIANPAWSHQTTGAVGGMVFERYAPFNPVLKIGNPGTYRLPKEEVFLSGKTIEVDATGCACLMVSTQVYIDMATTYPWFKEVMLEDKGEIVSEDVHFCFKMRGLGYRIYVDTSIDITHMFLAGVNRHNFKKLKECFDKE